MPNIFEPTTSVNPSRSYYWYGVPKGVVEWDFTLSPDETRRAILLEGERQVSCINVTWRGYYPPPFIVLTDKGLTYTTASPGEVLESLESAAGERTLFGLYDGVSSGDLIYRKCSFSSTYTTKKEGRRVLEL